ncbi:MAG TPA: phosphoribosylglycinamide formyltransferase [Terracidiphilus sp.]|jgi:phosphoribosylglycinamide formyltransferase 1|nr:phosphoribosylglycinamide formyltransferase [Terracidiphilus sp.]
MSAAPLNAGGSTMRLGILLSGRGSNFLAIAERIRAGRLKGVEIAVVVTNVAEAGGLKAAQELGLPHAVFVSKGRTRAEHDANVIACLKAHGVDLICLAGYMRLLSPQFVAAFPNRILNIHPSLLPAFPGLEAQEQAFAYGVKVAGCTVHFVDEHLDHGVIVVQRAIAVLESDDAHSLSERILAEEHGAYSEAIGMVASGEYEIRGRRFVKKSI